MKAKLSIISIFVLALALLSVWAVGAQGPQSPQPAPQREPRGLPMRLEPEDKPFSDVPAASARSVRETEEVGNAAIPLGQPGLSFRYVQTFGVTEEPYPVDTSHLNGAAGLLMDASNRLYVAEGNGHRVLRFNALGANDLVLGHAGLPWHHDDYLSWPRDVAVDASGNIWVVFSPAVKKFAPSGNPLLTIPRTDPWQSGNDNYHFDDPRGIAFDSLGRLFVSDTGNHRIQVYDVSGSSPVHVLTIGVTSQPRSDNTGFNGPHHIAFDGSGQLYVVDAGNYRVQRCTRNPGPPETWTCTTFFGVTGQEGSDLSHLSRDARGIAIRGNDVFITDSANYRVLKCNLSGNCSHFAGTTGERGWDNAHFWWPEDVAVDSSGNVYVSDWDNHRVQVFNSGGTYSRTIGVTRVPYVTDNVHLNNPWGIAVAPDGSMYVTERRGYRVVKLNAAGVQQWAVGQAGVYGSDNNHFGDWWAGPEGKPAVDAAGRIYVPDMGNHRIQVFNPDGTYFTTFGSYGDGNDQFDCPGGVAISPVNGDILVADSNNHRVQIYTSAFVYKATLGVLDETGTDNHHFNWPKDVAVDASGNIYVADVENRRVQKCTLSSTNYTCSTFVGETGVFGDDFGHLLPLSIAVDGSGRVYVADDWNNRIQVFDSTGAYLTTIGGAWGSNTGQLRGPSGVAVDSAGNVYVADRDNHRIQKFAPGVPGWKQVNINGFGDRNNWTANRMSVFGGYLYVSTDNEVTGGEVWRTTNGTEWNQVDLDGFGIISNTGVRIGEVLNGYLYAGTKNQATGGEIWRSIDGLNWTQVVSGGFGDSNNYIVERVIVFSNTLYATTNNDVTGAGVWKSSTGNPGSWTQCNVDGFGDSNNTSLWAAAVFSDHLYVATAQWGNTYTGVEVWRCAICDGSDWSQVNTDGFGDPENRSPWIRPFNGYLYVTSRNVNTGAQIWRCAKCDGSDWEQVVSNGFGDINNVGSSFMIEFDGYLYAGMSNEVTGVEVWRTTDGIHWSQTNIDGFGDSNNTDIWSGAVFNNRLFLGTRNDAGWASPANGGEVWMFLHKQVYLPLVLRNR